MPMLEFRATVKLEEPIVLCHHDTTDFEAIWWQLDPAISCSVAPRVNAEVVASHYTEEEIEKQWLVNSTVQALDVFLKIDDVNAEDVERLLGQHPSEKTFVIDGGTYQMAEALGRRAAGAIVEAANVVLRAIRSDYGQYWLKPVQLGDSLQWFLSGCKAEWRMGMGEWKVMAAEPFATVIRGFVMGGGDQFLEVRDWNEIRSKLRVGELPAVGFTLISDAKQKFDEGEKQIAFIHLNSALEWSAQQFVEAHIGSHVPRESLRAVLKQSHARLLDDWVLPLTRSLKLDISEGAWRAIQGVRSLRREAAHPNETSRLASVTEDTFEELTHHSVGVLHKLLGIPRPKTPWAFGGSSAAERRAPKEETRHTTE